MARVNIPDARRVSDVRGHIEKITAQLQKEAAEQAEREKQAQEASRAVQQKSMPAAMVRAEDEGGSSGTDVLDLTDPEGYFARLQRRQENEARETEPAAEEKAQPEMTGKAMASKGKQKKAAAIGKSSAEKEASGKEGPKGPAVQETETSQKIQPDERVSTGPMDAAQKKTEKAVRLRTDPNERAKDLTNASREDVGQRVSGAAIKAHIAREKAMTIAQMLFYSAQEQPGRAAGEKGRSPAPRDEKAGSRREGGLPAAAGKEPSADKGQQPGMTGRGTVPATPAPGNRTVPVGEKPIPRQNIEQPGTAERETAAAMDTRKESRSPAAKAAPLPIQARTAPVTEKTAPAADREQPGKTTIDHTTAAKIVEGKSLAANAARGMEGKDPVPAAAKHPRPVQDIHTQERGSKDGTVPANRMAVTHPDIVQTGSTRRAGTPDMEQPVRSNRGPLSIDAGKQEKHSMPEAKAPRPEMGVTSQGKAFERFDLDKTLSNAYDTSKAYRTVMEMATFTHTNGRPVSVTHEGETLRFSKDQEGNTFAYINETRVEPLEAARFLVRYDRATLGGAAILAARLQLAMRDPFQRGITVPAKAPVPGKGKEAEKGKNREGKAEKTSHPGRETGTGR